MDGELKMGRRTTRGTRIALALLLAAFAGIAAWLLVEAPRVLLYEAAGVVFIGMAVTGGLTAVLMLYAWRHHTSLQETSFRDVAGEPRHSFSLILPARHEEQVLARTIHSLAQIEHPAFEVIVVVGDDDHETRRVAQRAVAGDPRFLVIVDHHEHKNKPRALNSALPFCSGEIVGVFDAEDQVAPGVLHAVDHAFQDGEVEVVQGATQLMNFHSSWFSVRNVLEYYFWFKSRLHYHGGVGFIPLGGNTVFIKRDWLVRVGGWDPDCLTEDAEIGTRLSAMGARTHVAYTPELVTREETPDTLRGLLRQRTRWNQGFLQVLKKGAWRLLPWRQRLLAAFTLAFPFLQVLTSLAYVVALAALLGLKLPIGLALLSFLPLLPLAMILVAELIGLRELSDDFGLQPHTRDYLRLIVGFIPYQLLLSFAAVRAALREVFGVQNWEKTAHVGAHLGNAGAGQASR
jgi:cellulose synthase/poly-beta-1,6-N-acetylglucosamine synthase-like glycosyltransferase